MLGYAECEATPWPEGEILCAETFVLPKTTWGPGQRRAGSVPGDQADSTMPLRVDQIVRVCRVDLEAELLRALLDGKSAITVGLGNGVDIPLLEDDLLAADVAPTDRQLLVATFTLTPTGWRIERHDSFGVYVQDHDSFCWASVPSLGEVEGLLPGLRIGLGSCPADAITFRLPSPPAGTYVFTGSVEADVPLTEAFRIALHHWRYDVVTFGGSDKCVIVLPDPDMRLLKGALRRDLSHPERGVELLVLDPGPGMWLHPTGGERSRLTVGTRLHLVGGGHLLGLGQSVVVLPTPVDPEPRFTGRLAPTDDDVAAVFGVGLGVLDDTKAMRKRYRALVSMLHPDRTGGGPGPTSRFVEVQACFEAWQRRED